MTRKKRRGKCRTPCECGWRVNWTARFRRQAQAVGLWPGLRKELRDIGKRLRNPETRADTLRMLREYCPYEVVYSRRRYRGERRHL